MVGNDLGIYCEELGGGRGRDRYVFEEKELNKFKLLI